MEIGYLMVPRQHPDRPYGMTEIYEDHLDDCVYAEELGFDRIWVCEHHVSRDRYTTSPLVLAAAIAMRTKRARVGAGVVLLPLNNPLRVAEDAAVIDIISGGRFDLGVGIGSAPPEFEAYNVPREEAWARSWEAIDFIERCFEEEEPFSHKGTYYEFNNVCFTTKPVQKPLPIWWGGRGPKSVARAAKRGYNLLNFSPDYDDALRQAGRNPDDYGVGHIYLACVAETRDEAWDAAQDGLHWWIQFYRERDPFASVFMGCYEGGHLDEWPPPHELRNYPGIGFVQDEPFMVGTPDDVVEIIRGLQARGRLTTLPIVFRQAGMSTPDVRRSMELFAREVAPRL